MTQQQAATVGDAGGGSTAGAGAAWRRHYWKLRSRGRRALRELTMARRLKDLRRRALGTPRYQPGCLTLDDYRICYDDLLSLYMEYKHIFAWGIYDFKPSQPRPLVLDCGSHIGLSILRFKRIVPDCRLVGFEPETTILELLNENVRQNHLTDVEVVPAALASTRGTGHFVPDGADGGALARAGYTPPSASVVPTVPLSDYLNEPVDLLKMNIEGAEWDVLQEAAPRLHNVRQMVVEYHGFPECGQKLHEILALLDDCGFRYMLHHFDYESNGRLRPPFHLDEGARFFQLIAATRLWDRQRMQKSVPHVGSSQTAQSPTPKGRGTHAKHNTAEGGCDTWPEPVSRKFGFDRGQPIDRHYIEDFLSGHREDVHGRVLEVGDSEYTRRFGQQRVQHSDVLHLYDTPGATVVADLTRAETIADETYDCFVLTQTLPFIFDVRAALRNAHRILKPGGVLLLTVPGIAQLSRYDAERWGDYWRFTPQGTHRLLTEFFDHDDVALTTYGNVRSAAALLDGRAAQELQPAELSHVDQEYPVIIAARAVK